MPVHDNDTFVGTTCAIIGSHVEHDAIDHVGLLATIVPIGLTRKQNAEVYDMGDHPALATIRADRMACISNLDAETLKEMRLWALKVIRSGSEIKYVVLPAWNVAQTDASSGAPTYASFSCAGFVERCYRDAGSIQLVVDEGSLPWIRLDTLVQIWPSRARVLGIERCRKLIGLHGNGPWRILMPAYLFHAVYHIDKNGHTAGPYQPVDGDWRFSPPPMKAPAAQAASNSP